MTELESAPRCGSISARSDAAACRNERADFTERGRVMRLIVAAIAVPGALVLVAGASGAGGPPGGAVKKCPADSVVSGAGCMDKYEASVWRVPNPTTTNKSLVAKIQQGKATAADLTKGGATQLGLVSGDYVPCAASGQTCVNDIYAVSLPGVIPS